jgi:hypothetical protein
MVAMAVSKESKRKIRRKPGVGNYRAFSWGQTERYISGWLNIARGTKVALGAGDLTLASR